MGLPRSHYWKRTCLPMQVDVRDAGSIPGLGRYPGVGNVNPLQYSCLENPHEQRSLAGYSPWGRKESDTTERLKHSTGGLRASQGALVVKNPPANAGDARDMGLILGSERSPGGGNGHPLQYSGLENPMDRGAWRASVHRVTKSQTQLK